MNGSFISLLVVLGLIFGAYYFKVKKKEDIDNDNTNIDTGTTGKEEKVVNTESIITSTKNNTYKKISIICALVVIIAFALGIASGMYIKEKREKYAAYRAMQLAKEHVLKVLRKKNNYFCDDVAPYYVQRVRFPGGEEGEIIKFKCIEGNKIIGYGTVQYSESGRWNGLEITTN